MTTLDETHDLNRKSWVESANPTDCPFPIQNLPLGVISTDGAPRVGTAIGNQILDLSCLEATGLLPTPEPVFGAASLNAFMALGPDVWTATRRALSNLLSAGPTTLRDDPALRRENDHERSDVIVQNFVLNFIRAARCLHVHQRI